MTWFKAFLALRRFSAEGPAHGRGGKPAIIVGALLLNGAWGIGVAAFMRLLHRPGGAEAFTRAHLGS
jgi:hypothetical protein